MPQRARYAVPIALVLLAGCAAMDAGARLDRLARQDPGTWMPVQRTDFPAGDPLHGTPTTQGSQALRDAVMSDAGVGEFVRQHGVPDAIAVSIVHATRTTGVDFAYLYQRMVYHLQPPMFSWTSSQSSVTGQRPLADAEVDVVDQDRILARQAQVLQDYIDGAGRLQTVARRILLALPPPATTPPGESYGILWFKTSPVTARHFGHPADADGIVVVWVHPDGPASGQLEPGDRVIAIDGMAVADFAAAERAWTGTKTLTVERDGRTRAVALQPEVWPRRLQCVVLQQDRPNAFAGEAGVAVTTGMLALVPSDDALAWVIGHELAHVTLGHTAPRSLGSQAGRVVIGTVIGLGVLLPAELIVPGGGRALGQLVRGVENRFNRDQERDADRLGIQYMRAAGYDPTAAYAMLDALEAKAPVGSVAQFLDVHPPYPERRELVAAEIRTGQIP